MTSNAAEHDQQRAARLQKAADSDAAADAAAAPGAAGGGSGRRPGDTFLAAATQEVYGSMMGSGTSLEARIGSRKHFNERR